MAARFRIREVTEPVQLGQVKQLLEEYGRSRRNDPALKHYHHEIDSLPGAYSMPQGGIWLGFEGMQAVGCIALRPLETGIGEVKRMYVSPNFRKQGLGKQLLITLIHGAQDKGYLRLRLDSLPTMQTAQRLYEAMGFNEIPPYWKNPNKGVRYFELVL